MSKEQGTNVLLYVRPAGSAANVPYSVVKGQQDATLNRNRRTLDTTDKTTKGFATAQPGLKEMTVDVSGQAVWSDTDGYLVLHAAYDGTGLVDAYMRENAAGRGYVGTMMVVSVPTSGGTEDMTNYSVQLQAAGAMTAVTAATFSGTDQDSATPTLPQT